MLHEFFERACRRAPGHVAVEIPPSGARLDRQRLTYAELQQRSANLAGRLRGVAGPDAIVAVLLPRTTPDLFVAQLGVLKAGAAHACLDPSFPDQQLRAILSDAAPVALVTDLAGGARARRCGFLGPVVDAGETADVEREPDTGAPPSWLTPRSLAYLIYTSGTTGRPKGVMTEHGAIVNLVAGDLTEFRLTSDDRVGQGSSPAYDSSIEESWLAFAAGATLVVLDEETVRLGPDLVPWLRRERITVLCPPPTLLRSTGCRSPSSALPDLRLLYVGGEALPQDIADAWAPGRRMVNGYGPTECAVTTIRAEVRAGEPVTIGTPIPGVTAHVLGPDLEEVVGGEQGELCLGGACLARGYRHRPDLTEERFIEHAALGRLYRTGDAVRYDAAGHLVYEGRLDLQVKLRGYRIELEAIEAQLLECPGVRDAACAVQGPDRSAAIVAFVVPAAPASPPSPEALRAQLGASLPPYMVPTRIAVLDQLPTTVGGKLDRRHLPMLGVAAPARDRRVAPRDAKEAAVAAAFREVLGLGEEVSIHDDFFAELGGDSVRAAELVSRLRADPETRGVAVRDVYEAPTVASLANRITPAPFRAQPQADARTTRRAPLAAVLVQLAWLSGGLLLGAVIAYGIGFGLVPDLLFGYGVVAVLLLGPLISAAALAAYAPLAMGAAVLVKRVIVGRYQPLRAPVWGSDFIRVWMVQRVVSLVPWAVIEGTVLQLSLLRALGARIGRGVHIERGVDLRQGGWDLLEIGDNVSIGRDAFIRLVDLQDGEVVIAPIAIGDGTTIEVRGGVAGGATLGRNAYLGALSSVPPGVHVPDGERWDGVPATCTGPAPPTPLVDSGSRPRSAYVHTAAMIGARLALLIVLALPLELLAIACVALLGFAIATRASLVSGVADPRFFVVVALLIMGSVPVTLVVEALVMRLLGPVRAGVISRWSLAYVRVTLKTALVESAGNWLSGTLFWPPWLRMAGMRVGGGCEISTIIDVVPELIDIGEWSFLADGIYLGGPHVHRGTVTLAATELGANTFVGNHAVIAGGEQLPNDVLIGISTPSARAAVRPGTSWFGNPPFELPRRVPEYDRRLTHEPSAIRYATRVFWEVLRVTLPVGPLLGLIVWVEALALLERVFTGPVFLLVVVPVVSGAVALALCVVVLVLKWILLGRVRSGMHPLWSCWCSRWDFLFVAWRMYGRGALSAFEGTAVLPWYLRAMGMRIGRGVVLGPGFAQVVDPDMLAFDDGATVACSFQAHTFEDRVLKIDRITIGAHATAGTGAVLLYGADVGARAHVAPQSVVMKRERLLAGQAYEGVPTQAVNEGPAYEPPDLL